MSSSRRTAGPALALAVLLLAGQLGAFAHVLLVPHFTCPEHGELIHLEPIAHASSASSESPAVASTSAVAAHGDEHCLISSCRRQEWSCVRPADPPAFGTSKPVVMRAPATLVALFGVVLLRLAPKASPPV